MKKSREKREGKEKIVLGIEKIFPNDISCRDLGYTQRRVAACFLIKQLQSVDVGSSMLLRGCFCRM